MLYVFALVLAIFFFFAIASDVVQIGGTTDNLNKNAPSVIQTFYSISWVLMLLMSTAFLSSAGTRDFTFNTSQIVFATPLKKWKYLLGRFLGAFTASLVPALGITAGMILASAYGFFSPDKWGPIYWASHLWGWICFVIPNSFFIGALIFAIASLTRSSTVAFVAAIVLLMGNELAEVAVGSIENETLSALADPFGSRAFGAASQYLSPFERNTTAIISSPLLIANRILWCSIGAALFGISAFRFSFAERNSQRVSRRWTRSARSTSTALPASGLAAALHAAQTESLPQIQKSHASTRPQKDSSARALWAQFCIDFRETVFSRVFLILLGVSVFFFLTLLTVQSSEGYGLSALPVTYSIIEAIQGVTYIFLIAIIIFYSGVLVWKERESKLDEVYDAMPHQTWVTYAAKLTVLVATVLSFQLVAICVGMLWQAGHGYFRFQPELYVIELLGIDMVTMVAFAVLSLFIQIVSPNKYVGYFAFVGFLIVNSVIFVWLDWSTQLASFGAMPSHIYSDFFGFAPFSTALINFGVYWIGWIIVLGVLSVLLWQRGRETRLSRRLFSMKQRFNRGTMMFGTVGLLLALGMFAWIGYNTMVVNELRSSDAQTNDLAIYETKYRKYLDLAQPRVTGIQYEIDLYPEERRLVLGGIQTIQNKTDAPIETIHFSINQNLENRIDIDASTLTLDDEDVGYRIYTLDHPLQPGEERSIHFETVVDSQGFEQSPSFLGVVQNGSFFNSNLTPQIRYQPSVEISDKSDRNERDLGEPHLMATLEEECGDHCANTYISNNSDWIDCETVISTSLDQIAIAPGSLQREWTENGRRYFHYRVDHPSLNFSAFMSARYEVKRDTLDDIQLEVYYLPEHAWNVDRMIAGMKDSLAYYTEHFGPYEHKQARIIEFPRTASFAQAFPGTMPYSEGIGFIADLNAKDAIDLVYYVVAHEMAHQWWAHQVIGSNTQGSTVLSETLAQYSALMVMEQKYGRDMMRKFLAYEMDQYLKGRSSESLEERPLVKVEAGQGYIHYRKGSVLLYFLKERVGEATINAALKSLIQKYAYREPPYPNALDLVAALREEMNPDDAYLLTDLFEKIIFYDNRVLASSMTAIDEGKFEVTLEFSTKKVEADGQGKQTEVEMDDWIEIGAFASPEPGALYGKTLFRESLRLKSGEHSKTFVVDERPDKVGVDPFFLLIDRVKTDNLKTPSF